MTKQQFESLPYRFTQSEIHQLGLDLARANQEVYSLRSAKKTTASSMEASIKAAEAHAADITRKINEGAEFRETEVTYVLDAPRAGQKTLQRVDTGETVRIVGMTPEDRQETLAFNDAPADGKTAAAGGPREAKRRSN